MALGPSRKMPHVSLEGFKQGSFGGSSWGWLGAWGGDILAHSGGFLCAENLPYHKNLITEELSLRRDVPYGNPHAAADNKRGAF